MHKQKQKEKKSRSNVAVSLPVLPVFFIEVLFEDSVSKPSRVSSWNSVDTLAS